MKAVIFDMDGVIADTQKIHGELDHILLKECGIDIPGHELSARFAGIPAEEVYRILLEEHGKSGDPGEMFQRKEQMFHDEIMKDVEGIEGSVELVHELHERGIPIAVASSTDREGINHILKTLGILELFKATVSGHEVPRGKPAPDVFLRAAELINTPPELCIVVEDGIGGVMGAQKAGMKVIGFGKAVEKIADISTHNMGEVKRVIEELLEKGVLKA